MTKYAQAACSSMKSFALLLALFLSLPAYGALSGVTEFNTSPEQITDTVLSELLRSRIASADVIAIGESVHGSSGFLRIQARLIRYLIANHGLRLIVWENPTLRSLEFSRWVASCTQAKSPAPIAVLYMPTAADLPLWDWVCNFNFAHPHDPIVFRGMDVWDRPWEHYAQIRTLGHAAGVEPSRIQGLATSCPAYRSSSWADIEIIFGELQRDGGFLPAADYQKCRADLALLLDAARQTGLEKKRKKEAGSDEAFELAISASTLLGWLGFYHYNWSNDILSWNERDQAQSRNLSLAMAKHDATRAILSAHTSHVSHNRSAADWWGYGDLKSGVYFFTALTRKKVFNIALTAYSAAGTQGDWSLPTAANSLDKKLRDAGHTFSYFASNAAFLSENPRWWMQNQNFPGPYESGVEIIPADHFDAFIFFERSPLDKALPQRSMWQP
jgi:erythromycin esterase-like protein